MQKLWRRLVASASMLVALGSVSALCAEARFLSFSEELRRARMAIGQEAECRVLIEDLVARCDLLAAGTHSIRIQFADVSAAMLPRKSVTLIRGTIEPAQFTGVLAVYGLPTEVTARCLSTDISRPAAPRVEYAVYIGDYAVTCDRDVVTITYARRF